MNPITKWLLVLLTAAVLLLALRPGLGWSPRYQIQHATGSLPLIFDTYTGRTWHPVAPDLTRGRLVFREAVLQPPPSKPWDLELAPVD